MSNIWFTSDTHFGHRRIIEYCDRPFDSVDDMNRGLIENWNEFVDKDDVVYFLGDFSLDFKWVRKVMPVLNGKIHLVAGNHDQCHSSNTGSGAYITHYEAAGFVDICESKIISIGGEEVLLSHLPYVDDDDPDQRYQEIKPINEGLWHLHGHVHTRWKTKEKEINVGVDVWDWYPVSTAEILEIMKAEPN